MCGCERTRCIPLDLDLPNHPLTHTYVHACINTGLNKKRVVQRAVMEELVKLVDSGTRPYQMKKGACAVVCMSVCVSSRGVVWWGWMGRRPGRDEMA